MSPRTPDDDRPAELPAGRKPRTADCARCEILIGLRKSGLPASRTAALCERFWLTRARRRQLLFLERNRATHVFALRRGRVKLTKHDSAGNEHIVTVLETGALFGLDAMFDGEHGTSAEVLSEHAEICVGARPQIEALIAAAPGFGAALTRYVLRQLDDARSRQACLGTVGAKARFAAWLLHEAGRGGDGADTVPHDLTLAEYGAMLGTSAETVCRVLGDLRSRGLVAVEDARFRILEPSRLRLIARI